MKYALRHGYEMAIQFDADGQHDPAYISSLVAKMDEAQADIVVGSRFVTGEKPKSLRMMGSNLISGMIKLTTGARIKDPTSGMRLYNKRAIQLFATQDWTSPEARHLGSASLGRDTKSRRCRYRCESARAGRATSI